MPRLEVNLLGPPRIERDGTPIKVDTRKAIALLAYLAVTGEDQSRDTLAALFWPEGDQSRARGALRRTLSVLNKALGGMWLKIDRESVGLDHSRMEEEGKGKKEILGFWSDVAEFYTLSAECRAHGHPATEICRACVPLLARAAGLHRGDFLAGFTLRDSTGFDDWQYSQTESLRRDLAGVLERLVRAHSATGELDPAIAYARRWLALDPLHEPAHRHLMQLYVWSGKRASALRQYRECVRVLEQELGVSPLEETTRLYEMIKENRPGSLPPQDLQRQVPTPKSLVTNLKYPFVGRSEEWQTLLEAYETAGFDGQFVVLEGEAGIGKTKLAEEFLENIRDGGGITVSARCYEGESGLAYGPFMEALRLSLAGTQRAGLGKQLLDHWLAEAGRLLPEPGRRDRNIPPAPPLDSPGARSRFFEGLSQVLLTACEGPHPGVLFLDDVHWADEASLDLLAYLVRRMAGRPAVVLATWRKEQVPAGHRLRRILAETERAGLGTRVLLARLSRAAVEELVQAVRPGSESAKRLYQETEGLPLFIVEYLARLASEKPSFSNEDAANWSLPGSVRDLLASRLGGLNETTRQLIHAAAVIGRSFDFDTLRETSGRSDEETVEALEAMITQGLVAELRGGDGAGAPTYDFSHEKLRALAYEETSLGRRRLLHRRVAEALIGLARREGSASFAAGPSMASQIAEHYRLAGRETEAAEYFRQAGERARALYANAEALAHFRSALALGYPDSTPLHEAIGELQMLSGDYAGARASLETAAALSQPARMSGIEHKLGNVYHRIGEWKLAETHFQAALAAADEQGSPGERARIYADWSRTAHHSGKKDQAVDLARLALDLAESSGDKRGLAQANNILGVLASSRRDFVQASHHLEKSLALAEELADDSARAAALNNMALALGTSGETGRALELAEASLKLCVTQGDRHREAAVHSNLADLYHGAGQYEEAMVHLKHSAAIYGEIGGKPGDWQPEVWKLVQW